MTDSILSEINEEIKNQIQDKKSKSRDEANKKSGETGSRINEILDALQPVMQFPLTQKYSKFNSLFNREGDRSQDKRTKQDGCINEREYSTQMGTLASIMGFAGTLGGSSSGSSGHGSGGDNFGKRDLSAVEFGGLPIARSDSTAPGQLCEDATVIRIPDPGYGDYAPGGSGIGPNQPRPGSPCSDWSALTLTTVTYSFPFLSLETVAVVPHRVRTRAS